MPSSDVSRFTLYVSRLTFYASRLWNHGAPAIKWALVIFATMRFSLSLIAAMALFQFPLYHATYYHGMEPVPPGIADYLLGVWQRFDTIWYIKIAMQGYAQGDGSTVFFPLYPLLTRIPLFTCPFSPPPFSCWGFTPNRCSCFSLRQPSAMPGKAIGWGPVWPDFSPR